MSTDLPHNLSDPQALESLPFRELVAIILQQQQTIKDLQQQLQAQQAMRTDEVNLNHSREPGKGGLTVNLAAAAMPPAPEQPPSPPTQTPHLMIQTETSLCHIPLTGSSCWTIGRGEENNIVLSDRWMSRNHAIIQAMGQGEIFLIDLGSRNGTFINGRRVSIPISLQNGDRLTFGQTDLTFYSPVNKGADNLVVEPTLNLDDEASATALLHVRRLITVLVVDIRNFTTLTRKLDERLLSEVIGTWFRCAGEIIREYGSWVDKYIGDAVMAVWIHGTRQVSHEEMKRIFLALSALNEMTSQLHQRYPLPFPLRIGAGINTGYAMVGNTGSGDRPDYTALGDTVNAAFRLETCTKQLGLDVALGGTTYQYLLPTQRQQLTFREHTVSLKGYDNPIPTYAGTFGDLNTFLQIQSNVNDTLY